MGDVIQSLSSQTSPAVIEKLAKLLTEELARLTAVARQLAQLQADDPTVRARELKGHATRLERLRQRLSDVQAAMSEATVQQLREAHALVESTSAAAKIASESAFGDEPLKGVGSETWRELWQAARRYSEQEAYPGIAFPATLEAALCVLCQQPLQPDAAKRFSRFESFVKAETQKAAASARRNFDNSYDGFIKSTADLTAPDDLLAQLDLTHPTCATSIHCFLTSALNRRADVLNAIISNNWDRVHGLKECPLGDITPIVTELNTKATALEVAKAPEKLAELKAEHGQLIARQRLSQRKADVLAEIERFRRLNALAACQRDVDTTAISRKSTELTKSRITKAICDTFKAELNQLGLAHLRVDLVPTGSERGVMYHRVELHAEKEAAVQDVASEGEYRCIALAGFLAELVTASHKSALVFDDPVSSLDHMWRESVARRLVSEAKQRQVIVFTHDLVFLLLLLEQGKKATVLINQAQVRRGVEGSGLCDDGAPWLAMDVKNRVGFLKSQWQEAEKPGHARTLS